MTSQQPEFSKLRGVLWPIHGHEMKKFLPTAAIMFFVLFNYTIVRNLKDVLVITAPGSSAEVVSFIKSWVVFPCSILFVALYTKLSDSLGVKGLYYACLFPFLIFFGIFAAVIYPNRELLHPDPQLIEALKVSYPNLQWLFPVYGIWTYAAFYTFAELWGNVGVTILVWQFANEITRTEEAKRFYSLFGFLANFALIAAGRTVEYFSLLQKKLLPEVDALGITLNYLMSFVVLSGLCIGAIYLWMHRTILKDPRYYDGAVDNIPAKKGGKKKKPSLGESLRSLMSSKYLGLIAILVLSYNMSINLVEVTWKKQIHLAYPSPEDYAAYMGGFFQYVGIATILILFSTKGLVRRFGWFSGAIVTPVMVLLTGSFFFSFVVFRESLGHWVSFLGTTPVLLAVFFGACQNIGAKGTKYSLFDPTNNMAYIPLDQDSKVKGKAAVDVIGGRLGKSGGGYVQQILLIVTAGTQLTIAPYLAVCVVIVCLVWIGAVCNLSKEYKGLLAQREKEASTPQAEAKG